MEKALGIAPSPNGTLHWPKPFLRNTPRSSVTAAVAFEEAAYSTHAMGEEQRAELQSLLTETERLLYDGADRKTKFRLKYVECLHA